jgi:hypothetical protein
MRRLSILAFASCLAAGPVGAMEWTATDRGLSTVIEASGEVEAGDDQRLRDIAAQIAERRKSLVQRDEEFRVRTVIEFNSPGGNLGAGLQIGLAIRELGLATRVPDGKSCASACTYAFLGGVERRVLGPFGVHAMSASSGTVDAGLLDQVQEVSAILLSYLRDMVGRTEMAEAGLRVSASNIYELSDDELRDWNVITHVSRPGQYFTAESGPLSRCGDDAWREESIPHDVICADLAVARHYLDIAAAVAALHDRPDQSGLDAEQARWEKYWQSCETAPLARLTGPQQVRPAIETCMREAFAARAGELAALAEFYRIGESEPAKTGWKAGAE